jgi:hypothetical protein
MAILAIQSHDGPILVDLDETLYLRNSTEDFIDSAKPGLLALLALRMLEVVKPWKWTGGHVTRDVWRVQVISCLLPWTGRRWRARVGTLASKHTNMPLLNALKTRSRPTIIVTVGFQSIVTPLIAAMGLGDARIVAARSFSLHDRRRGKLSMATEALGEDIVRKSLVVTDSTDDLPLLDKCAEPLRTIWPTARYAHALRRVYFPSQYLTQVKRPGERYIVRGIVQEDFAFWLLSSLGLAAIPGLHILGLLLLLFSFWAIYECGYVDNDHVAQEYETDPKLTIAYFNAPIAVSVWQAWLWALASGALAIALLRWPGRLNALDMAIWAGVLAATQAWFWLYNRFDKGARVWMFPVLQFARSTAFVALVPINPLGAAAIAAHVLARWMPYCIYRFGNSDWPNAYSQLMRLVFFIIIASALSFSLGKSVLLHWSALALFLWCLFRARREIKAIVAAASRIDRRHIR